LPDRKEFDFAFKYKAIDNIQIINSYTGFKCRNKNKLLR
jgi:hypothetical protein